MSLPPPPGVSQPVQPVIPNAADDPFGAMNAMAAVATVQRAPEIVIVNDGKPVENVGHQSMGATLLRVGVPGLIALILGIAIGKIGESASSYNGGLDGMKNVIAPQVKALKSALSELDTALDEQKKSGFRPNPELDKTLREIAAKLDPKEEVVWRAKQGVDSDVSKQILQFMSGVAEVKRMLDTHIKAATTDDQAFKANKGRLEAAQIKDTENAALAGRLRYGIVLSAPTESDKSDPFGARFVELGPPYCGGDKMATSGRCQDGEPSAYAYRAEVGAGWSKGDFVREGMDSVPSKKVVPLLPGGVLEGMVKGADGMASEAFYRKRLDALYERVHGKTTQNGNTAGLLEEGNKLDTRLQAESSKGSRFSFFM